MKLGMWTSFPHQNPGETSRATCCRHYTSDSLGSQPCGAGAATGNGRVGGGWCSPSILRWPGKGQRERASRRRAEMPRDVHLTRRSRVESFMCVNSCLPCSSEDDTPSPVCPASLLTLLSCFRCIGGQGQGAFNNISPGQGLAKEDLFPCLPPPHFSALQLLCALWCSLLSPLPPPWSWAPVIPSDGIILELMRNKAGQSLGISPAPDRKQTAVLAFGGGSGGVIITCLCPGCLQSCW